MSLLAPLLLVLPFQDASAVETSATPDVVPVREVLAIESMGERRRSAVYTDALQARLARGDFVAPVEGDVATSASGEERTWTRFEAGEDGWFSGRPFRSGWAYAVVDVPESGAWMLDASGHSSVLVNGEPHTGDVYRLGTTRIPLALEAGPIELLFRAGRGSLRATLERAPGDVYFEERDRTLPDVIRGEAGIYWLGLIVSNATASRTDGLSVRARVVVGGADGGETIHDLPSLLPSSQRKCAVPVELALPVPLTEEETIEVELELRDARGDVVATDAVSLAVRNPNDKHVRTFLSDVDGSVQYYAVTPPTEWPKESEDEAPLALFLSLHGASVEGRGQANAYAPKDWGVLVAPTNRRPYGFDWEDWGRLDALEVLDLATQRYSPDPRRIYLTGHSMGGHGTWQIGAHFPDRFAAIAPSAGWRDFWAYAGGASFDEADPIGALLARSVNASRTELLERNYLQSGVYVLHGDADETVSVDLARMMRERLATFHPNFAYYERPGAGHWWGNQCMDWPPLFRFLKDNVAPEPGSVNRVEFATVNPGLSSRCEWVTVERQVRPMETTRVVATLDIEARRIDLEADNASRLVLDLGRFTTRLGSDAGPVLAMGEGFEVVVDGATLTVDLGLAPLRLARTDDGWSFAVPLDLASKGPHRAGMFKDAFRHRIVFVYATRGDAAENAWALRKARYDHEVWRYRGNGSVDVVADVDFRAADFADRGVVLYGNRDTNAAWSEVLDTDAFDLARGGVRVGDRTLEGDDLALLATFPRKDSDVACVAVIGGTGDAGSAATDDLPYFVSGVAYPDWTVLSADFLTEGLGGFRGAGFFGPSWTASEPGAEAVWR